MKSIKDFFHKALSSRKFWAAVAASGPFAIAGDWNSFAAVWMGYAGIQGGVDAVSEHAKGKRSATLELPDGTKQSITGGADDA